MRGRSLRMVIFVCPFVILRKTKDLLFSETDQLTR
jgi:hypothetical protein